MSRRRQSLPFNRYSLSPERKRRRVIWISPALKVRLNLRRRILRTTCGGAVAACEVVSAGGSVAGVLPASVEAWIAGAAGLSIEAWIADAAGLSVEEAAGTSSSVWPGRTSSE